MKRINLSSYILLTVLVLGLLLTGCRTARSEPNTQATIDAAVAATANAQQSVEATIAAAVAATAAAQATPPAPTAVATPVVINQTINLTQTTTVNPTPVAAQDYTTLSEEELVALIEQSVAQAAAATSQYSTETANATADDTVTTEEAQTVEVYVQAADEAINTAEEAMAAYYELYYDLAVETQAELAEINQTLEELSGSVDEMNETLVEINETLNEGVALAEETIASLEETAQAASTQVAELQQQAQTWQANYQAQMEARVTNALNIQPTQRADTPQAALQDTFAFLQSGQQALADQRLTPDELTTIAQLGANAKAGLAAQNQPQLQQLSGSITAITEQLARGNFSQARGSMDQFNNSLGGIAQLDLSLGPADGSLANPPDRPDLQLDPGGRSGDGPLVNPPSRPTR
jgi:hypothetical protein